MKTANKILIVDDDRDILDFLIDVLQDEIGVSFAPDGTKALELAKAHRPDLILLDVEMPEMDGFEVCRQLKLFQETKDIPIIFLTGKDSKEDVAEGLRLGAVDYITKPFDPQIVIAKVKNQLANISALRATGDNRRSAERRGTGSTERRSEPNQANVATGGNSGGLSKMSIALIVGLLIAGGAYVGLEEFAEVPPAVTVAPSAAVTPPASPAAAPKTPIPSADLKWPFNSKCAESPIVSWWGTTTHFSMVDYVERNHGGDWNPYRDKWVNQMNKMQSIYDRAGSAKVSDGTGLRGEKLKAHVMMLKERVSVIDCLATEARLAK